MVEQLRDKGAISLYPFAHEHVAPLYLPNLKKYRYTSSDLSLTSRYIMRYYWEFVIGLIPMFIAPNMLTLIGFACGISSTVILLYYYFFGNDKYPVWCWYFSAVALFFYQTLDAIDGKQARRTGTGSPLGELFDHGCDAVISVFVLLNVTIAMNLSSSWTYAAIIMCAMSLFFSIWEQYSTGTLEFGYISAPTEGILLICFIFAVTGFCGRSIWDASVFRPVSLTFAQPSTSYSHTLMSPSTWMSALPRVTINANQSAINSVSASSFSKDNSTDNHSSSLAFNNYTTAPFFFEQRTNTVTIGSLRSCFLVFYIVSFIYTTFTNILHVFTRPSVHDSHFTPFAIALSILFVLCLHLLVYLTYKDVQQTFPFAMEVSFGFLIAQCATRLTISRICKMPYNSFFLLYVLHIFILTWALLLNFYKPFFNLLNKANKHSHIKTLSPRHFFSVINTGELYVGMAMELLVVVGVLLYLHLVLSVFTQFANYMHINILTIAPRKLD